MVRDLDSSGAISAYSISDKIESICHDFAAQHRQEKSPDIAKYLATIAPEHRGALLAALIPADMERRYIDGEKPSIRDYEEQFPEHREELRRIRQRPDRTKTIQLDSSIPKSRSRYVVGQKLLHFVLLRRLGRGSFGEVWQAMDTKLTRTVAVKIPHASVIDRIGFEGARHEGQAAAQLRHANIVTVFDIQSDADVLLIVSELIDGVSLKDWLKKNQPSLETTALLCAKLAEGLDHAHHRDIIHRDLKPSNVLMDEAGEPHITDFGLAKNLAADESIASDGQIMGTPAYMSPEQADGKAGQVDGRSDVFSLGVMLYEMLTGQLPFDGDKLGLLRSIKEDDPRPPRAIRKKIPLDLETICLKALEKDPARRYASAQEMAVDLRRWVRGDAIVARRAAVAERVWRYVKKHPARIIAVVVSLLAMLALGTAMNLAQANRELLGLRPVSITTNPPGAKIALAPLDPVTGEPDESRVIFAPTRSPVQLDLAPGDYFLVAMLDNGRFHEVFRMVPDKHDNLPGARRQRYWQELDDGTIGWQTIEIPTLDVADNMAYFDAATEVPIRTGSSANSAHVPVDVPAFYIDRHEFTGGQLQAISRSRNRQPHNCFPTEDHAVVVSGERAMSIAETAGRRLPFDHEFIRAATAGDFGKFSRDATDYETSVADKNETFLPAGLPDFDRITDSKGGYVWGLRSNVAEVTASRAHFQFDEDTAAALPMLVGIKAMIVRGGDSTVVEGSATVAAVHRDPQNRVIVEAFRTKPGLGFRGVRSAVPHFFYPRQP